MIINCYSDDAESLVFNTGAAESLYEHVRQIGGPALGWWQMEPATHDDIWSNFLRATSRQYLIDGLTQISGRIGIADEMVKNPWYAAAMCRIHYLRVPKALPAFHDFPGQAAYWKKYYNTPLGAGTEGGFLEKVAAVRMRS
jgi:hypothetical protein